MTVTALLVSHDGARWLPAVLEGLAGQTRQPDRLLAIDTGSSDGSADLLREALGDAAVREEECSFPEAIARLLPEVTTDWVWILHDDANPAPTALAELVATATRHDAAIAGPKLREWPSLLRLLELGVSLSATGRRETGLERGEYDQGQHDKVREVLAVNTAGMLVRRDALEALDGFDRHLPLYGNDIDFGWRAARAGLRTVVVPTAVVFHAEAAHRGVRRSALSGRRTRTHRYEREAALYTLLVNSERWFLPGLLRLTLGTVLRVLGYLLARQPGHAGDEFAALLNTYGHLPGILHRRRSLPPAVSDTAGLRPPWWLPYRHGLDTVTDFASAVALQGRDAADRRRVARAERLGLPAPVPVDEDELADDTGLVARYFTSPLALAITAAAILGLWAARVAFGPIAGGALSPAPAQASDWWHLALDGWHQLGQGTDAPAPGYVLPFALAATVLFGSPTVAVSVLFLVAVPFAGWGAWRFLRAVCELVTGRVDTAVALWGAIAYAAVPVASGAWGQGRFGIVASAALLPWFAHVVTGLFETSADRRWRAAWRGGAMLALLTAFTPSAWLVALMGVAVLLGLGFVLARDVVASKDVWLPLVVVLLVPAALMLPGAVGMVGHDPAALFLEAGRLSPTPGALDLIAGRVGGLGAPVWAGLLLLVPGLAALLRARTRVPVLACWILVAVAAVVAAILSHVTVSLPAGPVRPGLGFLVVVVQGALLCAAVIAAQGLRPRRTGVHSQDWRFVGGALLALVAVTGPVVGLGWWVFDGDNLLDRPTHSDVPAYMVQAADEGRGHGVLVIRGDAHKGITWEVHRGSGITLGEDEVLALTGPDQRLDKAVRSLVSRATPQVLDTLTGAGIDYVLLPTPASAQVAAGLDAADGLTQASAPDPRTRAWQLTKTADGDAVAGEDPWWHRILVTLQLIAIVVVAVLCGPTRREEDA
ncbi:glycosyltransferase family 2 protein [Nocardioides jiangxiensis]|uniref:Glycosyltransferase family 2 protein n=1 Tax=Nocardioides jiangxiensis TaxID=3064524 RepID=A0ABT9B1I9_9ACTN|nr:glycosyltransferase family 2 protein [Nocardioides sp. WY-20]MDO7867482.1 glycosyltransferase family 2 protein [Nocardioides sp. WY-20]